jgi:hypothetical protein
LTTGAARGILWGMHSKKQKAHVAKRRAHADKRQKAAKHLRKTRTAHHQARRAHVSAAKAYVRARTSQLIHEGFEVARAYAIANKEAGTSTLA